MFYPVFFLTARPWAERGSCFTRVFFLTARPWAERGSCSTRVFFNRAAMGRARFMFYPCFFSVVLPVTRPKLLSARLRMTQLKVFIRVKNVLQIYEYYTLFSIEIEFAITGVGWGRYM